MRLAPLPPASLPTGQRAFHEEMAGKIDQNLKGFVSSRDDGALVGPFAPMLHFPHFGKPAWDYTWALIENAALPKPVREVAILVTGAALNARCELYAHERIAQQVGLSDGKIASIAAGQRPPDLDEQEAVAYDVASALSGGRTLPQSTYDRSLAVFGPEQTAELVYLIGGYCLVSVLLNAYDVSVPGREEDLPNG